MAKTLLDAVNEIFKRVKNIAGDQNALTSLEDGARQHPIDVAIQVVNEGVDYLYSVSEANKPKSQGEATITLAEGTRDYALATDMVQIKFPLIDKTNTQFITQFPGGYDKMLLVDPEQDDTGLPVFASINPVTGMLHMDRAPTSDDAGRVYTYQYEKDLAVTAATDQFPFSDVVFRAMVPAWVQLYKREERNEFDGDLYKAAIGTASRNLTQLTPRESYSPR